MTDLLSTLRLSQYRNSAWREIDDAVTRETGVSVSWRRDASPCGENDEADAPQESFPSRGSAVLWACPRDLAPLALGHVLLDRVPAPLCLHREAGVEATAPLAFAVRVGTALTGTPPPPPARWEAPQLLEAMRAFIGAEGLWDATGCFHRAGVFSVKEGRLLVRAEDIGRHNCIDRLAGWSVQERVPLSDKALLISARLTASLCAKALRAGFRVLVSRSAVTTAALEMAARAGATLAGFTRADCGPDCAPPPEPGGPGPDTPPPAPVKTAEDSGGRFTVFTDVPGRITR